MALNLPLMVIGLASLVVSAWSFYNGKRFAGRERRRPPGRIMGDALALHFGVQPADLTRWQRARRLRVRHDARGLVVGVETEFGVDKVDRRPADHADPLPWIEGLVVAREDADAVPAPTTPRHSPVIMPPSAAMLAGEFETTAEFVEPTLVEVAAPREDSRRTPIWDWEPVSDSENALVSEPASFEAPDVPVGSSPEPAPKPSPAQVSGFDPSMLADLGLFTADDDEAASQRPMPSFETVIEPESQCESEPGAGGFEHGGRQFYF